MREIEKEEIERISKRYNSKIVSQLKEQISNSNDPVKSREFSQFKKESLPGHMNLYEKACQFSEKLFAVGLSDKKKEELEEQIRITNLEITPGGSEAFAFVAAGSLVILGILLGLFAFMFTGELPTIVILLFVVLGGSIYVPVRMIPKFMANSWRIKASNQMVVCIFYVVTYMRHTSNLELALKFAADHINPPLALDLKKVLWDVETNTYSNVKDSLDAYLDTWKLYSNEFIEAFHLIEASLYEGSEARRLELLDKSLDVILEETYEKMLHYAHNLQSPITALNMLGIVLPILGLVILPLVVSFMEGIRWYHIAILYNILLPIGVYYLSKTILSTRPSGYGQSDQQKEEEKNYVLNLGGMKILVSPFYLGLFVFVVLALIGLSPLILHMFNPNPSFDFTFMGMPFLDYHRSATTGEIIGPYGVGASILGIFIILGIGLGAGMYFKETTKKTIKIRNRTEKLELEFASSLFQMGNRLADGIPAEIAFSKTAEMLESSTSGSFFKRVDSNIRRLGVGVEDAIFNSKYGAIRDYPSNLVDSSMKVLIESMKKGPLIAAQALMNISRYVKEMHRVNERLRDLMADTIANMKSQIKFLSPAIAGIVVGITSMITTIIGNLGQQMQTIQEQAGTSGAEASSAVSLVGMMSDGVPTYYFQVVVGLYVIQVVYILTVLINGIEKGSDDVGQKFELGKNLISATLLYSIIATVITIMFNVIAQSIMSTL